MGHSAHSGPNHSTRQCRRGQPIDYSCTAAALRNKRFSPATVPRIERYMICEQQTAPIGTAPMWLGGIRAVHTLLRHRLSGPETRSVGAAERTVDLRLGEVARLTQCARMRTPEVPRTTAARTTRVRRVAYCQNGYIRLGRTPGHGPLGSLPSAIAPWSVYSGQQCSQERVSARRRASAALRVNERHAVWPFRSPTVLTRC